MEEKDKLLAEIATAAAEYKAAAAVEPLPYQGYEDYLQNGNRIAFEDHYFARRRQLAVLALAAHFLADEESLTLLEQVLWEVCNEYTWALPAHLPIKDGVFAPESATCLDLFAAETGGTLAEIYELLGSRLSPFLVSRLLAELNQRILDSFEGQAWGWEELTNNWSSVIAGNIGLTALAVLPAGAPRQKHLVARLDKGMQSYLRGFEADGACEEGVGYWGYGFGYFVYYGAKLAKVLGDRRYLDLPKVKAIASFPYYAMIRPGSYLPFSDASATDLPSGLVSWCREELQVPIPTMTGISSLEFDPCYRFAQLLRNLQWTTSAITAVHLENSQKLFANRQWLTMRNPQHQCFFAAKGGSNEESHNHLDVGHFIFGTTDELFLTDLGAGEYTRDYFNGDLRYTFFVNDSRSHHLPVINGQSQQAGKVAAQIVDYKELVFGEKADFELDLTKTYPEASGVSKLQRRWQVDLALGKVVLTDNFTFTHQENLVQERFVTQFLPQLLGEEVKLVSETTGAVCQLECPGVALSFEAVHYPDHQGVEQVAYVIKADYLVGQEAQLVTEIKVLRS